jgi:uncharacterized phage infection (PIP) family protein YhgE
MKGRQLLGFLTIIEWLVVAIIVLIAQITGNREIYSILVAPALFEIVKIVALFDTSMGKLD